MKRKRKKGAAPTGAATCNPKLAAQTRTVLRAHYAAKYRSR